MSRQIKKKEINKYKIKINKLQNKIYELEYLFQIKSNACDELLQDNKKLKKDLEFKENLISIHEENSNNAIKAIEKLKSKIKSLQDFSDVLHEQCLVIGREKMEVISERNKLKIELRNLRAENYNLKNRGFFQRVLNRG